MVTVTALTGAVSVQLSSSAPHLARDRVRQAARRKRAAPVVERERDGHGGGGAAVAHEVGHQPLERAAHEKKHGLGVRGAQRQLGVRLSRGADGREHRATRIYALRESPR
jgi:hypothetical protein